MSHGNLLEIIPADELDTLHDLLAGDIRNPNSYDQISFYQNHVRTLYWLCKW